MLASAGLTKSNKIALSDYNYLRDVEHRLLFSQMTPLALNFLDEIVHGSLKIPVKRLAKALDCEENELLPLIDKFQKTKLFTHSDGLLLVDKEMRKFYETEIAKFEENFEPNIEFLKNLLKKVPLDTLFTWYAIPRTSDDIIASVIEKYLSTPKGYQRHITEVASEEPQLAPIIHEVFSSPNYCITTNALREKFALSAEEFASVILTLEFHFICCLTYRPKGDGTWEEVIAPFHEWHVYLQFLRDTLPTSLPEQEVAAWHKTEIGFLADIEVLLHDLTRQSLPIRKLSIDSTKGQEIDRYLPANAPAFLISQLAINPSLPQKELDGYLCHLIGKLLTMELAQIAADKELHITPAGRDWLKLSSVEKAQSLYALPFYHFETKDACTTYFCDRNLRDIERSLRKIVDRGWVLLEEFLASITTPLQPGSEIYLIKKGRSWCYALPQYTEEEREFLRLIVKERFLETGLIRLGQYRGGVCISSTSFGKELLRQETPWSV